MQFVLLDRVIESSEDRLVAVRALTAGEEYLRDHFEGFPVMPGVLMVEAMAQACRELLARRGHAGWVLGETRGVRFNSLVRPGQILRVEVRLRTLEPEQAAFQGSGQVLDPGDTQGTSAVTGRLTMRPPRVVGVPLGEGAKAR